jgi:type I restriction enzyme S subunit
VNYPAAITGDLSSNETAYVRLRDVARIRNGKDYRALTSGHYPVYGSGGVMTTVGEFLHDRESVLIPRKGSLSNLYYVDTPFWTVDTIFFTEIDTSKIVPKFFFYFLKTQRLEELNQAGGVPSLTQAVLNEIRIAVPPLEIQREIVRVLDIFTSLEAELEAELEARRRQYTYYRDALFTFGDRSDVRWTTLGDVGTFTRGRRFTKADMVADGLACIHYGEIYTRYGTSADSPISRVRADMKSSLRFANTGDVIIAGVGETVEDVGKAVAWLGNESIAVHDDCFAFRHDMNPKFVAYWFQTTSFNVEKVKYVARAKVKRLSGDDLAKLRIPIPPLAEQARIVATLDAFDALVNDLSSGLPAEIAARRQQYEHYRDRLLTFREAS